MVEKIEKSNPCRLLSLVSGLSKWSLNVHQSDDDGDDDGDSNWLGWRILRQKGLWGDLMQIPAPSTFLMLKVYNQQWRGHMVPKWKFGDFWL